MLKLYFADRPEGKNSLMLFCLSLFLMVGSVPAMGQGTFSIEGKVVDRQDGEPVPFAQVALYEPGEDAPLMGTVTEEDGTFELQASKGKYELRVVFMGYAEEQESVTVRNRDKDVGTISMAPEAQQLEEVVVEAEAQEQEVDEPFTTTMEGMQINPDQMVTNTGGSLLDILRNTPSVNVGEDGGVSLRGSSGTNILIDGRNSALASDLEQIPASAIERIEVVNNPNAKYDAQAAGGVINIILKRGEEMGTTGSVEATVGTRYRLNTAARLSHRTTNYSLYGGYSYRRWPRVGTRRTIRETFTDQQRLEQHNTSENIDHEHTFNYGGEYFFGRHIISYEGVLNTEREFDRENRFAEVFNYNTGDLLLQSLRRNAERENNLTLDNALIYELTFDNPEQSFRALVSNSYRDQQESQYINAYSGTSATLPENPDGQEQSYLEELRQTSIVQLDYVHPLAEGKLEGGYKAIFRSFDNDFNYSILDDDANNWVNQEGISNHFLYTDQVHGLYFIYTREFENFLLSAGSRVEQTFVKSRLRDTNEENTQQYINLFPSLQMQYMLNEQNAIKFTYSRRIDRPSAWRLNPFPDVSDSLNIRTGNPELQPELIHSLELGHMLQLEKLDFTSNLFYRRVDGQLDYIVRVEDGISYRRPENLNTAITYGFELIGTADIFPWWKLNASYSLFRIEVDGSNLSSEFNNKGLSWYTKFTSDFSLPAGIGLQLTANYTAPEIEAQGRDFAYYYLDASLTRSFFDDKARVSLTLRDVFDIRQFTGENYTRDFYQRFESKRESRIFLLNLRYSF